MQVRTATRMSHATPLDDAAIAPRLTVRALPLALALASCLTGLFAARPSAAADRLILRNLQIITDQTVTSVDEDGVRLSDGRALAWDTIERGKLADAAQQAEFDRLLADLGDHLYRIRQRLETGDYAGLSPHAEAVYPRYADRRSVTAYMVCQATMWSRLAAGKREAAVDPYLRAFELLRAAGDRAVPLPGNRRLQRDPETALSGELAPIWFDAEAARAALPGVLAAAGKMKSPRPEGIRVYYASLALAAGETEAAERVLSGMPNEPASLAALRDLALTQRELQDQGPGPATARLAESLPELPEAARSAALYWLGKAALVAPAETERRQGVLKLLHLPALYGSQQPELAAAALFDAQAELTRLGDKQAAAKVRQELTTRYRQTRHAGRLSPATTTTEPANP